MFFSLSELAAKHNLDFRSHFWNGLVTHKIKNVMDLINRGFLSHYQDKILQPPTPTFVYPIH